MQTLSNSTALWLTLSVIAIFLIGMAIAGVMALRSRQREAEEDHYFPPDSFPEIEIEGHRYHYDRAPFA